jgi:hypothetical protein
MVQFCTSEYDDSMKRYEQSCRSASASNQSARANARLQIENELVEGGIAAIEEYESELDEQWDEAQCLAEYDGISMAWAIAQRARLRLTESK